MRPAAWPRALLLLLLAAGAARGEEPARTPASDARDFAAARAAGDDARATSIATDPASIPILVADALVADCAAAAKAGREIPVEPLAHARAWAEATQGRRDAEGLAPVVERWAAWDAERWRSDERLRGLLAQAERALAARRAQEAATVGRLTLGEARYEGSVAALRLALLTSDAMLRTGNVDGARAMAERARAQAEALPSPDLLADAWLTRVDVERRAQAWTELEAAAGSALEIVQTLGRTAVVVELRLARVDALRGQTRHREALARLSDLATQGPALSPRQRAEVCQVEAILRGALGETDAALALLDRAAELYLAFGERRGPARMRQTKAFYLARRGDLAEARRVLDGVIDELEELGDHALAADARSDRAEILLDLGLRGEALADVRAALERARVEGRPAEQARWLVVLAHAAGADRDHVAAAQNLDEALALHRRVGARAAAFDDALGLALVNAHAGEAARALEGLDALAAQADPPLTETQQRRLARARGLVLADLGRGEEALAALDALSRERTERGGRADVAVERRRARLLLDAGRPAPALEAAMAALGARERQTRGHSPEETAPLRHLVHADADLALAAVSALRPGDASLARASDRALQAMEESRSRWLAHDLALATVLAQAGVGAQAIEAHAQGAPAAGAETARAAIVAAQPRLSHLLEPRVEDRAGTTAGRLPPRALLLLYHVGEARDFVLAIPSDPKGAVRLIELPRREPLAPRVNAWLALVAAPGGPEGTLARALGATLLEPLGEELRAAEHVVISPDRELAFLPFEALSWSAGGLPPRRLVETHTVTYVPSATVLAMLRAQVARVGPGEGVLAVGDPVYEGLAGDEAWPRLLESGEEARAVAALLPGPHTRVLLREQAALAGLDAALATAGRRRVVHLACHGFFDPERPAASGLVLSGGELLTPYALLRRRLDADLVVLSACETGRGTVRVGDGVDGFVRTLFVAGAPRVLVSGWRVPDRGTRDLMEAFYAGWLKDGLPAAAALRRAKVAALAAGGERAHPSRWAAFTLWGLPE